MDRKITVKTSNFSLPPATDVLIEKTPLFDCNSNNDKEAIECTKTAGNAHNHNKNPLSLSRTKIDVSMPQRFTTPSRKASQKNKPHQKNLSLNQQMIPTKQPLISTMIIMFNLIP